MGNLTVETSLEATAAMRVEWYPVTMNIRAGENSCCICLFDLVSALVLACLQSVQWQGHKP